MRGARDLTSAGFSLALGERRATGEPFNPMYFGTAGIANEPNLAAHRSSKRSLNVERNNAHGSVPSHSGLPQFTATLVDGLMSLIHADKLIEAMRGKALTEDLDGGNAFEKSFMPSIRPSQVVHQLNQARGQLMALRA